MAKKRKGRDEVAGGVSGAANPLASAAPYKVSDDDDDAVPEAEITRRFDPAGWKRLHPRPLVDASSIVEGTELWIMQLPYECELAGEGELHVERDENGALCMRCTAQDGTALCSVVGPMSDYGSALYATPPFLAGGSQQQQARRVGRVVTFADAAYEQYVPAAGGEAGAADIAALTAAGLGGGAGAGKRLKREKREKDKGTGVVAGVSDLQQQQRAGTGEGREEKTQKKKDKHKDKKKGKPEQHPA